MADMLAARQTARQQNDPHVDVCFLATITPQGHPDVRAVSLRNINDQGLGLLLNSSSPKWHQLLAHGCCLHILWSTVRRQYRVHGRFEPMPTTEVQRYWQRKGHGSRLLEHYYEVFHPQSQPIPSRDTLLQGMEVLKQRYPKADAVPIPETLQGVYLFPTEVDVWHGSPSPDDRLHDRHLCIRTDTGWTATVLVP